MRTRYLRLVRIIAASFFSVAFNPAEAQIIKVLSGDWSGMAHFKARISEQGRTLEDPTAALRTEIYFTIDKQGNIRGRTISNGCQINGLATPWIGDNLLQLQVNFSGCSHIGFNRRFTGHLQFNTQRRTADLLLTYSDISPLASRLGYYEIKGNVQL